MFLILLVSAVTLSVLHYFIKFNYWKRRGINGPTPYPFVGNSIDAFVKDLREVDLGRRDKYGDTYGIYMGTIPLLVTSDPEIVKIVCQKDAANFTDINVFKNNQRFFRDSFITKKGKEWKEGRNLVTPVFTTKKIKDIYPQIQKAAKPYFENIENMIKEGKQDEVDVKKFAKGFSLDVVAKFVFAFDLNSAADNDHPFIINARNLTNFKVWKMVLFNVLPAKVIEIFDLQILNAQSIDYMGDLIRALTKQRRQNADIRYNDFLDLIVHRIDENNLNVTENEIIAHCIIFFFAGIETVAMTVSNVLLCLATYPEYQERLYKELKEKYPNGEIEYDHLNDSKLLDAIIKETQRLYPALNRIIRINEKETEIKGIKLDAHTAVAINVYSLHMNKNFWSEPEKFYPERFLEDGFQTEDSENVHFAPFGCGPRICVAQRMATVQVKYVLARTIMNYQVRKSKKTKVEYMKNPMALTYNELKLSFSKRNDSNNN